MTQSFASDPSDMDTYIRWSDKERRAARPGIFQDMLVTVPPEELRDELLSLIESKREHLRTYPASCSARAKGRRGCGSPGRRCR